jgi:hypothetical protein
MAGYEFAEVPDLESAYRAAHRAKGLATQHRAFADKLAERQSLMIPAENPDYQDLGLAFPTWTSPGKDAILHPPKPQIQPSEQILERATSHDLDMEAVG